jgi:selenocysteine-specific elongation factor
VHLGAADVLGRVALLDDTGLVQLVLDQPIGAVHGERFIVRDQSARRTLGGGAVIDVFPPPRGRAKPERLAWLAAMERVDDPQALAELLEISPTGVDLAQFAANRNLPAASGRRFSQAHWRALREKALANLAAWHARAPDAVGPAEDRALEGSRLPRETVFALVEELVREGRVVREDRGIRLSTHRVEVNPLDAALWQKIEPLLKQAALRPPTLTELAAAAETDAKKIEAALSRLARHGRVVRVSKNRFFLPASLEALEQMAHDLTRDGGELTAAALRDRAGIGRNLTIEVLEFFDRIKFTRRVGDAHVLLQNRGQSPDSENAKRKELRL